MIIHILDPLTLKVTAIRGLKFLQTFLINLPRQPRSKGVLPSHWAGGKELLRRLPEFKKARSPGNEVAYPGRTQVHPCVKHVII